MLLALFSAGLRQNSFAQDYSTAPPIYQNAYTPAPPPSAPPQLSAADLQRLVSPIALYPDPLLAVLLPAAAYPLEITQAARFVRDPNNLPNLDAQNWDPNVKAIAKFAIIIQYMDQQLDWTIQLGQAFVNQPLDVMNAIQSLRAAARAAGTLQNSDQQVVDVTNAVVERSYGDQIVYVTNTVIQIEPVNPEVIYVPVYDTSVVYYPPPGYVYNPLAPLITFGAGIAIGVIWANHCDWHYGGVYYGRGGFVVWGGSGPYHPPYCPPPAGWRPPPYYPPPGYRPPPPGYRPPGYPPPRPTPYPTQQPSRPGAPEGGRWQPDQGRRQNVPTTGNLDARGWTGRSPTQMPAPSTGWAGNRPNAGTVPAYNRPAPSPTISQPVNRPSQPVTSPGSAFGGVNNANAARDSSYRGSMSRGGGGGGAMRGGRR